MPADRLLITLLRHLQTESDQQDTPRLLSTAASLLTTLSNPRNLTLLTSQLLLSPAIWTHPDGLRTCLRLVGVFQSAALTILQHENEAFGNDRGADKRPHVARDISREQWVRAVVQGADERSPRWRHLLVIAGVLIGFEGEQREGLSKQTKSTLQQALVNAANLVMEDARNAKERGREAESGELGAQCVVLTLNYSFELLSDFYRSKVNYDRLIPILMDAVFFSDEGYRSAYFLVDSDIVQISDQRFSWSDRSPSFMQINDMATRPLISTMGPLSRLISHAVENVHDSAIVMQMVEDMESFAATMARQYRRTKISEVDFSEEALYFDETALSKTLPALWKIMRSALFAITIILRSILGRALRDRSLAASAVAEELSIRSLNTLRDLYFIAARFGTHAFSQYNFVHLTAIDILAATTKRDWKDFLANMKRNPYGQIPEHPMDRSYDLFFLNTVEHLTTVFPADITEEYLIPAASPYLESGGDNHLLEIFEAAHSVMLAVFSAPQNAEVSARHLPFYVGALFKVFPSNLSARQFRLAFKTLLHITTPPSALSTAHPELPETLMEVLHHRAEITPPDPKPAGPTLPANTTSTAPAVPTATIVPTNQNQPDSTDVDERTALVLALIDSLPFLAVPLLADWLPLTARLVHKLDNTAPRRAKCVQRFWEVLSDGEMDVERAQVCVAWWATRGGREMVLFGEVIQEAGGGFEMSSAAAELPLTGGEGEEGRNRGEEGSKL